MAQSEKDYYTQFHPQTLKEMLDHFQASSTKVDDDDVFDLITSWEVSEDLATKLARDNKIQKQLLKRASHHSLSFDWHLQSQLSKQQAKTKLDSTILKRNPVPNRHSPTFAHSPPTSTANMQKVIPAWPS